MSASGRLRRLLWRSDLVGFGGDADIARIAEIGRG
jgi:hypothetical protein